MTATFADALGTAELTAEEVKTFHGFGGVQGGLVAALALRAMRSQSDQALTPLELSVHYLRAAREIPTIAASVVRQGRAATVISALADVSSEPVAMAQGVFTSSVGAALKRTVAPRPPEGVIDLSRAETFVVPPEFVPIATRMELRPATSALPYSGSREPELCSWIRLTDSIESPSERLLVLADALAPSYAAVLTGLLPIPTVRLTVRFTPAVETADFQWVLVRAATTEAHSDRWLTETIDMWTPEGHHLATATQLRLVRAS